MMEALPFEPAFPRSRGENLSTYQACVGRAGSSPLTLGKPSVSLTE